MKFTVTTTPSTPFIEAALAEQARRAADPDDISPYREWRPQPDMLPDYSQIPGYGPETSTLVDLDTGRDLSNPRIQDLDQ